MSSFYQEISAKRLWSATYNNLAYQCKIQKNVKYKRTDALSLWHQQQSTTLDIHGPLKTRGETRCPGGASVSGPASRTRHECPRHNESAYMESWNWMWTDTI